MLNEQTIRYPQWKMKHQKPQDLPSSQPMRSILPAALTIARRDPAARLVFLPSDHYVEDESRLAVALQAAATKRTGRSHCGR
jgi:hypothetical protein